MENIFVVGIIDTGLTHKIYKASQTSKQNKNKLHQIKERLPGYQHNKRGEDLYKENYKSLLKI